MGGRTRRCGGEARGRGASWLGCDKAGGGTCTLNAARHHSLTQSHSYEYHWPQVVSVPMPPRLASNLSTLWLVSRHKSQASSSTVCEGHLCCSAAEHTSKTSRCRSLSGKPRSRAPALAVHGRPCAGMPTLARKSTGAPFSTRQTRAGHVDFPLAAARPATHYVEHTTLRPIFNIVGQI